MTQTQDKYVIYMIYMYEDIIINYEWDESNKINKIVFF